MGDALSFVPGPPPDPTPHQRSALVGLASRAKSVPRRSWVPVVAAASEWCVIALCVMAVVYSTSWWVTVIAVVVIGCRQQGLAVLMHEGVHRQFHRDLVVNDWLSDHLCAWPLFTSTAAYRSSHLQHHRALNTERDPDWVMRHDLPEWRFPMSRGWLSWVVLSLGFGRGVYAFFRSNRRMAAVSDPVWAVRETGARRWSRLLVAALPAVVAWWTGHGWTYLTLWVLPLLTVVPMVVRIRVVAEHYGMTADSVFTASRDWDGGALVNWLVVPWRIRLHRTHHLFPGVPFDQLSVVQNWMESDPTIGPLCPLQSGRQVVEDLTR